MRSRYGLALASVLLVTLSAQAAPHVAIKPFAVDGQIPTYKNTHKVGQVVWMTQSLTPAQKKGPVPSFAFTKFSYKQGEPPDFLVDRGYYPCTLKEAKASINKDWSPRDFAHATPVWVDNEQITNGVSEVGEEDWNRNEMGLVYNKDIARKMRELKPGKHEITVWHQLNYRAWVMGSDGYHFWDDHYIALAKGRLEFTVLPNGDAANSDDADEEEDTPPAKGSQGKKPKSEAKPDATEEDKGVNIQLNF